MLFKNFIKINQDQKHPTQKLTKKDGWATDSCIQSTFFLEIICDPWS